MAFNDKAWGQLSELPGSRLEDPVDPTFEVMGYESSPVINLRAACRVRDLRHRPWPTVTAITLEDAHIKVG
jgi:hypothetical protein